MADAGTGAHGTIQINAVEVGHDAAGNWSDIAWSAYLIEAVSSPTTFNSGGVSANVVVAGPVATTTPYSGSFTFDWRPSGLQSTLIASGTTRVTHNPDGTGSATVTLNMGSTGTTNAGGPSSVSQGVSLTTLKVIPGTPTSITAVRVSDTAVTVGWAETSASNGTPDTNTIRQKINGGAWADVVTISPATSASVSDAANQKTVYGVKGTNAAGDSAWSADSAAVFTTPAAPTSVAAAKTPALDIVVSFVDNVAFSEHEHVITHGTVTGGVTTWDGSPLATVPAGTTSYTHTAPSSSFQHVYKVHAHNTDAGSLTSADVVSNTVILLVAPNAPTFPTFPACLDKAAAWVPTWTHNPVDTTAQTAYEFGYSTNGGSTWSSTGKVTSTVSAKTFAGSTYAANVALTVRVRTWGSATTGGSDGTGASPWSALQTVTFKTKPVATITTPANASSYTQAQLNVTLGFSQAEAATFVLATIKLYDGSMVLLETLAATSLTAVAMATQVLNGGTYTVTATVTDSNGLVSAAASSTFTVAYTPPRPATVVATYLPDSGIMQLALTILGAGGGYVAASTVSIQRTINGVQEDVVLNYPASSPLTILDTTPTIHGTNSYKITTTSASGATSVTLVDAVTAETGWAFLSTGAGYVNVINFKAQLKVAAAPSRSSTLVETSGRSRPIVLFGTTGGLVVSGSANLHPRNAGYGSTPQEVEAFILAAGVVCYRDPSGRRMFGQLVASLTSPNYRLSTVTFQVTETS